MIYLNTHLSLCSPHCPPCYPSKKKQLLFINFAFSLSISKKCCVVDDCICLLCRQYNAMSCQKKEKKYAANGMVLHVLLTIKRMNGVIIIVVMSEKNLLKIKLEYNYFVRIILNPSLYFQRVF